MPWRIRSALYAGHFSAATHEIQEYYDPGKALSCLSGFGSEGNPLQRLCRWIYSAALYEAQENDKIIVGEPEYLASFGSLMTDGNLSLWKEYVKTIFYYICSDWSDMESQNALGISSRRREGTVTAKSPEKISPSLVKRCWNDFCSQVYVENCFDKESKIEVEKHGKTGAGRIQGKNYQSLTGCRMPQKWRRLRKLTA